MEKERERYLVELIVLGGNHAEEEDMLSKIGRLLAEFRVFLGNPKDFLLNKIVTMPLN